MFAFCWIFAHVNHFRSVFEPAKYCKLPAGVPSFFFWFSHVNSAINPIIYFIFNNQFRQGLSKALKWKDNNRQTRDVVILQENFAFDDLGLERNPSNIKEERVGKSQAGAAVILQNDLELETAVDNKVKGQKANSKQVKTAIISQGNLAFQHMELETDSRIEKEEQFEFDSKL